MSIKQGTRTIAGASGLPYWGNIEGTLSDQTDLQNALDEKLNKRNPAFEGIPTAPTAPKGTDTTQIATTEFVQDAIEDIDVLPSQTGHSGEFLTTNGTSASWASVDLSNVVHKTGNETIGGDKTFTGSNWFNDTTFNGGYNAIQLRPTNETYSDISAQRQGSTTRSGLIRFSGNQNDNKIQIAPADLSGSLGSGITLIKTETSETATVVPPTDDTLDSTQIDTVGARNTKLQSYALDVNVLKASDNQTFTGTKTTTTNTGLAFKSLSAVSADTPTEGSIQQIESKDSNNKVVSTIGTSIVENGTKGYLTVNSYNNGTLTNSGEISILSNSSGVVTSAPNPTDDTLDSTQIDTVGARNTKLQNYALDNSVVKLTGNQTIAGNKTFSGSTTFSATPTIYNSSPKINYKWSAISSNTTAPSTTTAVEFVNITANDDSKLASIYHQRTASNNNSNFIFRQYNPSGGSSYYNMIYHVESGFSYLLLPHSPVTGDNSKKVATTEWFNNKIKVVSTLPASPTNDVFYFIKES